MWTSNVVLDDKSGPAVLKKAIPSVVRFRRLLMSIKWNLQDLVDSNVQSRKSGG